MTDSGRRFRAAKLLDGRGGARDLSDAEVEQWQPTDGLLWLDVNQEDRLAREWLANDSHPDANVRSILMAGETRPRSMAGPDILVVILRGINMNPGATPDDMVAIRMALQENRIVTSRRRKVLSVNDLRDALDAGEGPKTTGNFLVTLTGHLSNRIESAVENIEQVVESLDEELAGGDIGSIRVTLGMIRRQAAAIRRYLAPQRDAIDRIARSKSTILTEDEVFDLREEGDQLTRHIEDLDLARENALVTQEELMNRVALEQNQRMYLLSIVAAIFLPLTFISGLLGMNVAGLPGTVDPNGFIYSAFIMLACFGGILAYFRWKRWL